MKNIKSLFVYLFRLKAIIPIITAISCYGCPTIDRPTVIECAENSGACGNYRYEIEYVPIKGWSCIIPFEAWSDSAHEHELAIDMAIEGNSAEKVLSISDVSIFLDDNISTTISPYKYKQSNYRISEYSDTLNYTYTHVGKRHPSQVEYYKFYFGIPRKDITKFTLKLAGLNRFCSVGDLIFIKKTKTSFRLWVGK